VRWEVSKYVNETVVQWPEATVIYHPFLNETLMLEDEVEIVFIALKDASLSANELLDNKKLRVLLGELDEEASLLRISLILGELRKKELIEIAPLD
jgi:hypothetical protein